MGSYDSRRGDKAEIKFDRIKHWMDNGAQVSGTIHNLLVSKKLITGKKVNVLPKKRPINKEEVVGAASTPAAEASDIPATPAEAAPVAETPADAPAEASPVAETVTEAASA